MWDLKEEKAEKEQKIKRGICITTVVQAISVASLSFCYIMVNDPQTLLGSEWRYYQGGAASQCHAASLLCISGKVWAILS